MPKVERKNGHAPRSPSTAKYDAHHIVLDKTYGALADLRRELSDSKAAVLGRTGTPAYFRALRRFSASLAVAGGLFREAFSRPQDFTGQDWWPRLMAAQGRSV
jgi:hypothetical protein